MIGLLFLTALLLAYANGANDNFKATATVYGVAALGYRGSLLGFVPHNDRELRSWTALSITAGVCEELLYCGFLIAYFASLFGAWPAAVLPSVAFGIVHAYQGPVGIAKAAVTGLAMAGLFVLTGSLWAPMLRQAIVDINSGYLSRRAIDTWPSTAT